MTKALRDAIKPMNATETDDFQEAFLSDAQIFQHMDKLSGMARECPRGQDRLNQLHPQRKCNERFDKYRIKGAVLILLKRFSLDWTNPSQTKLQIWSSGEKKTNYCIRFGDDMEIMAEICQKKQKQARKIS